MKSPIIFGLAAVVGGVSVANAYANQDDGAMIQAANLGLSRTVELKLQLSQDQQIELAKTLQKMNVEVKDWRLIEEKVMPCEM